MTTSSTEPVISMTRSDLETLIRRVVREELRRVQRPVHPIDDWTHEGPYDPEGDEILADEALVALEEIKKDPSKPIKWEDFKEELARSEAAGELPD